jgi:hypothetical protein
MFARLAQAYEASSESPVVGYTSLAPLVPSLPSPVSPLVSLPPLFPTVPSVTTTPATSSVDELLAMKNPHAASGNGAFEAPPIMNPVGSHLGAVTQGASQAEADLIRGADPSYKKWFFDQQRAKQVTLLQKCKDLKGYEQLDSEAFQASVSHVDSKSQGGVPIGVVGTLLSGERNRDDGTAPEQDCPVREGEQEQERGRERVQTRVTEGKQLPVEGIRPQILPISCSETGTTSLALRTEGFKDKKPALNDESVKIYDHVARPPIRLDTTRQGGLAGQMVMEAMPPPPAPGTSVVRVVMRDPLFQEGTVKDFDFCSDLPETTTGPFNVECLQRMFRSVGGLPAGAAYPREGDALRYHTMPSLGAVKQYIHLLAKNTKSEDKRIREQAILDLFGVSSDSLARRAPFAQGVEVFWFVPVPGQPNQVAGLLKRTIETDWVQFGGKKGVVIPYEGPSEFVSVLQVCDVHAKQDFSVRFSVSVDHGFFLAVRQPSNIDQQLFEGLQADQPGLFANLVDGRGVYISEFCTSFREDSPNVVKLFYEDADGGGAEGAGAGHEMLLQATPCEGESSFVPTQFSLTCELRAPFLTYEVNREAIDFQELRHPGLFGQNMKRRGLAYHIRPEEVVGVPGGKGFVRMNSAQSVIHLPNLAYQSWGTLTMALRLESMPVKETVLNLRSGGYYYSVVLKPDSGSVSKVGIEHNFSGKPKALETVFRMSLDEWYVVMIQNQVTSFRLAVQSVKEMSANRGVVPTTTVEAKTPLYAPNMTWTPVPGQPAGACNVMVGTKGFMTWPSMYSSAVCFYDVAWIHFFDYVVTANDLYREARADWVYTQSPVADGFYKTDGQ